MRKRISVLYVMIACITALYIGFWYIYKKSMDDVSVKWYKNEYVEKRLSGIVKSIDTFSINPYKIVLSVRNNTDEFDLSYGVTSVDAEFLNFVKVGDSLYKSSGQKEIKFFKQNKTFRKFELNFCGKFDD